MASEENGKKGFGARIVKGASYEAMGFAASQVIRLGTNVVLTRLLTPEAFGLSALVVLVNQGLVMFSDMGLEPWLIQEKRGNDEKFLNTAWTLQIIQGILLAVLAVALAWPMAKFYNEQLFLLVAVGGAALLFRGFNSHAHFALRREMRNGPLVVLELSSQVVGGIVTITLAYFLRSVWALVLGLTFGALLRFGVSYLLPRKEGHRLVIDPEAKKSLFTIAKWVFLTSMVAFLSQQGDRLIVGKMVGITVLGVYSIAVMLAGAVQGAMGTVVHGIVFPALAAIKHEGTERLQEVYYKVRKGLDFTALPALGGLCALGSLLVDIVYDDRFSDAGWMLQLLVIRAAMACMLEPCEKCLFALGRARRSFMQAGARALWLAIATPAAYFTFGLEGFVIATALSEVPVLLLLWPAFKSEKLLLLRYELRSVFGFGVGYGLGFGVLLLARMLFPQYVS